MDGWVRLVSDQPIFHWGETPTATSSPTRANTTMAFYSEELLIPHLHL
jgi:hypothetical protein